MARQNKANRVGNLRIIGGIWRGRKLGFPDVEGLRPTGDRVRETVFNWLQPVLGGSRCLDLFAGSGALGLEAASRGASDVILVEADRQAWQQLKTNLTTLQANQCQLIHGQAEQFLAAQAQPFDLVFIDPPYQLNLWTDIADLLTKKRLLRDGARIYLEYPSRQDLPQLPESWHLFKEKQAGDVKYCLFTFEVGVSK
ncbi:16S rRNA (guanine(966)-N(2))-methyltransferase RsmD [Methylophaga sp.]|uniref:16S rRNA (guanine(966)-N(2))-methyltransferase RsmD n=1 Tax=Methylophaga sp. TaxID=2024840 RepID=UPI003F6985B7